MEFRSNPAQQNARSSVSTTKSNQTGGGAPTPVNSMQQSSKNSSTLLLVVIIVLIILLGLGGAYMWQKKNNALQGVESERFQAVFLTNGQVYFGKITGSNTKYLTLTNIYYLQAPQQPVQPSDKDKQAQQQPTQLTVVKLGNELHGPKDAMFISRDQVLFWENLKDDGKVVQAIKNPQKTQQ